ncbi:hypothetical protein DM450_19400 [Sphingomonas sp. IC081]|nr:hypothetical protein DM450_19400 [Sphingomonas sp. IC081]
MRKSDRPGKKLERLIASLERTLASSNATIEAPCRRLKDRDTNRRREHDVVITWDFGHHVLITAIECRDRSRPVGVPEVESFAKKCERTGVNHGVIVSARGFRDSAREKADACGILCMSLEDAGAFDWLPIPTCVFGYTKNFGHVDLRLMFELEAPETVGAVHDVTGATVSQDQIVQMVSNLVPLPDDVDDKIGKLIPVSLRMNCPGWTMKDDLGKIWQLDHIMARTTLQIDRTVSSFDLHRYSGGGKSYNFASCDVKIAGLHGQIVMVQNDDEEVGIWLIPDKTPVPSVTERTRSEAKDGISTDG